MKFFDVVVTQKIRVGITEGRKPDCPEFRQQVSMDFHNAETLEQHVRHLAESLATRKIVGSGCHLEPYGTPATHGITLQITGLESQIL